ncbi:hypothetical protein HAZT_HAZT006330 [Hyalella azteca]|uniref:RNA exonuclease 4 n=1 Tax=Hyalella azteca TaxID=294128 RepID=A0A6A0H9L4_HYAAZ|nr:RNA exonuclease 4-like [Hyalella azteca]KAA0201964.1 hypothetical protein HAZT_HAZT006330 [Hyalella azteca]
MKDEHKLAWFENVDPVLVDDDLIGPESPCQPSDAEVSDNEDAVEVDMDEEDDFIVTKESNQEQAERLKEKKRIDELSMNAVALDCEMVGVGVGGCSSALGRVSIVDRRGDVLYDQFAEPVEPVTDYRTRYSGIRPENLKDAPPFSEVQAEVAKLIKGRIVVGHALKNDFGVLLLSHPQQLIRDTSLYRPFMERYRRAAPSLKNLSRDFLGLVIQEGEHDSVTDARVAMRLYYLNRVKWERNIANGTRGHFSKSMLAAKPTSSGHGRSQRRRTGNKNKRKIGKASHSKSRRK